MFNKDDEYADIGPEHRPFAGEPDALASLRDTTAVVEPATRKTDTLGTDDDAAHLMLRAYYQHELDVQAEMRRQMAMDEAYYDGDQIPPEDRALLEARGQVPLVYNLVAPAVNWLLGTQRRHRTMPKILARTKRGTRAAERKTRLMKYVEDASAGEMAQSRAFADAVKVGIGWLETGVQDETEGEPVYSRHEPWRNIIWDTRATEQDLSDARYIFRTRWVDMDIAVDLFPQHRPTLRTASIRSGDFVGGESDYGDEWMDSLEEQQILVGGERNTAGGNRDRVRLIEAWYRKPMESEYLRGGEFNGEVYDPFHPGHDIQFREGDATIAKRTKMRVCVAVFCEAGLLYHSESPYAHNHFPFTPIWGNRKGSNGEPYGLIRGMRDIQLDVNRRAAKALHVLSTNKTIMDEGALGNNMTLEEYAAEIARPDAVIVKKQGKTIDTNVDRELGAVHLELFSRNADMIQQLSGITDESMGRTTNATSGRAIIARQNQGTMVTAHYPDNLRYALQVHGQKELTLIEQFFTEEKSFRITNMRGTPDYVSVNDGSEEGAINHTKADFIISEDDWKATVRQANVEELFELLQQLAPTSPQMVFAVLDLVIEAMDIPSKDEIVSRIRQITGYEDPDADPDAADPETMARREAKAMEAEMQRRAADAEIREKEATADEKAAKAFKAKQDGLAAALGIGTDKLHQIKLAMETALALFDGRPVAPAADALATRAEQTTEAAIAAAAQPEAQALPAPPPQQP
jgi:hypothetical protein